MTEISENKFKVIVKLNSDKNEIVGFDADKSAYIVRIKARAQDNKANIELIKFLSKTTGRKARILSGLKSKTKLIELKKIPFYLI